MMDGQELTQDPCCTFAFGEDGRVTGVRLQPGWSHHVTEGIVGDAVLAQYVRTRIKTASTALPSVPRVVRPVPKSVAIDMSARIRAVLTDIMSAAREPVVTPEPPVGTDTHAPVQVSDVHRHVVLTCLGDSVVRCEIQERWARTADWNEIEEAIVEAFSAVPSAPGLPSAQRWMHQLRQIGQELSDYQMKG